LKCKGISIKEVSFYYSKIQARGFHDERHSIKSRVIKQRGQGEKYWKSVQVVVIADGLIVFIGLVI